MLFSYKNTNKNSVDWLVEEVRKNGGIDYAEKKMLLIREEAIQLLYDFPASGIRAALEELVRYTTDRAN